MLSGVEQTLSALVKDESPLSYGLVVDNSGSLRSQITAVVAAARHIVPNARPEDEGFVVRFVSSDNIKLLQDFTSDRESLVRALDLMVVERGQTAIIDALHLAAERIAKKGRDTANPGRRAIILVSDGEERASSYKFEQLLQKLQEEEIRVYRNGLTGELEEARGFFSLSLRDRAGDFLTRVARETGGKTFFVKNVEQLKEAGEQIAAHLRVEYVAEFLPTGNDGAPASGKLEIKLQDAEKNGRTVLHRPLNLRSVAKKSGR